MNQFLRFLLLFGLLVALAQAADYSPPNPGPSKNLRAWSLLQTSAKQDALTATSNVTGSNATLNGYLSLSGQTMVSFEETSGQHFQFVRDIASFGKGCFEAFGTRFVRAVLARTRGIKSVIMISAFAVWAVGSARSEVLTL